MIRKIKKKDYDKYEVKGGFKLGQDVLIKEHGKVIYTIVGLDLLSNNVLLNDTLRKVSVGCINEMKNGSYYDIVYAKGAKKQKYNKWIDSDDIVEVL